MSDQELRQLFTSASMGHVAYHAWATQARRERRFNIARLFDALCEARGARAMRAFVNTNGVGSTLENVQSALNGNEPEALAMQRITGTSERSRELLGRAATALAQHRDLYADELGDLFVCTTCGDTREGELVGACPQCGAVPESHKRFLAIEAMGTLGPHAIMHALEHTESTLRAMLEDVDDAILSCPGPNNTPSLKEVLGHLN
ncbi:MAG: rubredoxin-type Fe(Cys)4 protein, partial [Bacteroidota bacterium]